MFARMNAIAREKRSVTRLDARAEQAQQAAASIDGTKTEAAKRGAADPARFCPNCSAELMENHCKLRLSAMRILFELLGFSLNRTAV